MDPLHLRTLKTGVLINTASGSCTPECEEEIATLLEDAGIQPASFWCGGGSIIGEALEHFRETKVELIIVLGGDGTIRTVIENKPSSVKYVIPLPGGTMNMLAKALYGDHPWAEVLQRTLTNPSIQTVSAGRIDDHLFFVAAILGGVSYLTSAREALREGELIDAAAKSIDALNRALEHKLSYKISETLEGEADAISFICPLTSKILAAEAPVLEMINLSVGSLTGVLKLASAAAFSEWRKAEEVVSINVTETTISCDSDISAVLDGEIVNLSTTASVSLAPESFTALVPEASEK